MEPQFHQLAAMAKNYTMTSIERMYALYKSIEYISSKKIQGDIVECGVWKGGSAMLAALSLLEFEKNPTREILLYDTFSGMSAPTARDVSFKGEVATEIWLRSSKGNQTDWCLASQSAVRDVMYSTGYPKERITLVPGRVEETIPAMIPDRIALLRLDTDWYESTLHELRHLYPKLSSGGILLIDDYGYWKGAKDAVDQYLNENGIQLMLTRLDSTGRLAVKP
jgi:hypothetical protein